MDEESTPSSRPLNDKSEYHSGYTPRFEFSEFILKNRIELPPLGANSRSGASRQRGTKATDKLNK